jgi:potassium-transporting ATPase KdpC subunit
MLQQFIPALRATILLTVLTGLIYPAVVTGLCQLLFPNQANGSLIVRDGQVVGSRLIGQNFTRPEYFHPRPSNAGTNGYDAANSGGFNQGPTNQKLADRIKAAAEQYRKENPRYTGAIPADAITGSASGLDPDITLANANIQAARVAEARGLSEQAVQQIVAKNISSRDLGLLGEPRVNVTEINLALDRISKPGNR